MDESSASDSRRADLGKVRRLVRRVLSSGGTDLDAVEELVFLQDLGDALAFTQTTDTLVEENILHEAFAVELQGFVTALLADNRLTQQEATRLRSSVMAVSGKQFKPEVALEPFEESLRAARP